jgi:hypothetical protein
LDSECPKLMMGQLMNNPLSGTKRIEDRHADTAESRWTRA